MLISGFTERLRIIRSDFVHIELLNELYGLHYHLSEC